MNNSKNEKNKREEKKMSNQVNNILKIKKPEIIGRINVNSSNNFPSKNIQVNIKKRGSSANPTNIKIKKDLSQNKSKIPNLITQIQKDKDKNQNNENINLSNLNNPISKTQNIIIKKNQIPNLKNQLKSHSHSPNRLINSGMKINNGLLPPKISNKKTLVLDLDETLVHSNFIPFDCPSDVIIKIELDNEIHDIHVLVRPFVKEFLEKMAKKYEIVIFTASLSKYADPLLDIIDKQGFCPFRLFREHCTLINTSFVKDLKRLGRDLKDIIIVDNSPISFALNPDNGLPILSWFDDRNDRELINLIPVLEFLSEVDDVRDFIKKIVVNNEISYDNAMYIINVYKIIMEKEKKNFEIFDDKKSECSNDNENNGNEKKEICDKEYNNEIDDIKINICDNNNCDVNKENTFNNNNINCEKTNEDDVEIEKIKVVENENKENENKEKEKEDELESNKENNPTLNTNQKFNLIKTKNQNQKCLNTNNSNNNLKLYKTKKFENKIPHSTSNHHKNNFLKKGYIQNINTTRANNNISNSNSNRQINITGIDFLKANKKKNQLRYINNSSNRINSSTQLKKGFSLGKNKSTNLLSSSNEIIKGISDLKKINHKNFILNGNNSTKNANHLKSLSYNFDIPNFTRPKSSNKKSINYTKDCNNKNNKNIKDLKYELNEILQRRCNSKSSRVNDLRGGFKYNLQIPMSGSTGFTVKYTNQIIRDKFANKN